VLLVLLHAVDVMGVGPLATAAFTAAAAAGLPVVTAACVAASHGSCFQ